MSKVIDELLVSLGLDTDRKSFEQAETMFNSVRSAALQMGLAIGGGVGIRDLTFGFARSNEELRVFSERIGVSRQFVDELGYAFERSNGHASEAMSTLDAMANWLDELKKGGGQEVLVSLAMHGIDPAVIGEAEDAADAFNRLSAATANLESDALRSLLRDLGLASDSAYQLFGMGPDGVNELMQEARKLSTRNESMASISEEFSAEMSRISRQYRGTFDQLSLEVLPELIEAARRLREFIENHQGDITTLITEGPGALGAKWGDEAREYLIDQIGQLMPSEESSIGRLLHRIDQNAARISGGMSSQDPAESTNKILEWLLQGKAGGSLVDNSLMEALAMVESGGRHRDASGDLITNPASGARGRYQIMPDTARDPGFGVMPLHNDSQAEHRRFAEDYLAALLAEFGDIEMALAAYNWGPGNVRRHGDQWREHAPRETLDYVPKVLDELRRLEATAPDRDDVLEELYRQPSPTDLGFRSTSDQPSPTAATGQPASPGTLDMGGFTIHIHDATDPQGTAREVERQIRKLANMAIDDFREPYV